MEDKSSSKSGNIFISHRHHDEAIANIFKETFEDWSNHGIKAFQSSDVFDSPRIGDPLEESIKREIADSNVVLLIYTSAEEDWSWCMYECGLAQDPSSMDTRIANYYTERNLR